MNIYVIRHGETSWNKEGRLQGSSDIDLTPYGIELAEVSGDGFAADDIHFDCIFTSPLSRAYVTADVIAKRTMKEKTEYNFRVDDRLREMCFGKYEGIILKEFKGGSIASGFWDPDKYKPDSTGESFDEMFARVKSFMDEVLIPLESDPNMKNVLVVCHGTIVRAFLSMINNVPADGFWKMKQPNCSINLLELNQGKYRTIYECKFYYESEDLMNRGIL